MRLPIFLLILFLWSCKPGSENNINGKTELGKAVEFESNNEIVDFKKLIGKWTEGLWLGVEHKNLPPPPPAIISEHDSIWPPYYEIDENQIKHFFLGIDSTKYKLDKSGELLILEGLRTDVIGFQKRWRILEITDSTMMVERKYSKLYSSAQNHVDGTDTVMFYKKR
ncbi:hypothetical protein [uncultured Allomuricauda sp.]|uniref:hypothetical protein n=1 Tax=Flagellimonas sp. W118 TaxID=3410791 RepID=UPI00261E1A39|nr:hypothetical protein [uncultured Allomuricauda sp.]